MSDKPCNLIFCSNIDVEERNTVINAKLCLYCCYGENKRIGETK